MRRYWVAILLLAFGSHHSICDDLQKRDDLQKKGWPKNTTRVEIQSSKDQTMQPALVLGIKNSDRPRPLLVGLHTWSGGFEQAGGETVYARWCEQNRWHFIHPHFRGPNNTAKALGSDYVVKDIVDSVKFMQKTYSVDKDRIYLVGVSGGGHAALLMAGREPDLFAGISAWCPISDIESWWKWHAFKKDKYAPGKYAKQIEAAIGGRPDSAPNLANELRKRSPTNYLSSGNRVSLDINHGIFDGRQGSVPFVHSIMAYDLVADPSDRIGSKNTNAYFKTLALPVGMKAAKPDPVYGTHQPKFRRVSNYARLTIFDGGHEIVHKAALNWLALQRRGQPAVWSVKNPIELDIKPGESKSNK